MIDGRRRSRSWSLSAITCSLFPETVSFRPSLVRLAEHHPSSSGAVSLTIHLRQGESTTAQWPTPLPKFPGPMYPPSLASCVICKGKLTSPDIPDRIPIHLGLRAGCPQHSGEHCSPWLSRVLAKTLRCHHKTRLHYQFRRE